LKIGAFVRVYQHCKHYVHIFLLERVSRMKCIGVDYSDSSNVTVLFEKVYPMDLFHSSIIFVEVESRVETVT
jgi:hypothetical protein